MIDLNDIVSFVTNGKGEYLNANEVASQLSGFNSSSEMVGKHYDELPSTLSNFTDDFIKQDNSVLITGQRIAFIQMFQYADKKYHCHLGQKSLFKEGDTPLIKASLFNITPFINPLICELLFLYQLKTSKTHNRAFCYEINSTRAAHSPFTQRELHCIRLLMLNYSNKMIAKHLNISVRTIESHFDNIKNKLKLSSKSLIISHCIQHRLLPLDTFFKS